MRKKKTLREYQWEAEFRKERRSWTKKYRDERVATTTLEQRKIFIESMRRQHGYGMHAAMKEAGIEDIGVAVEIYMRNSRPTKERHLVPPEKVR